MTEIKFSILIPVYNVEKYVRECLDSVLSQSYQNYEVIVIDDGSKDRSGEICEEYAGKDTRIKVYHQVNQGLMMARKKGIQYATGEYCMFLDSDDCYDSELLQKIFDCLKKDKVELLVFNIAYWYKRKKVYRSYGQKGYSVISRREMVKRISRTDMYNSVISKVIRTQILKEHMEEIYIKVNYAEDALQSAYFISYVERIGILDECLYYYRIRENSMIHRTSSESIRELLSVKDRIFQYLDKNFSLTDSEKNSYQLKVLDDFMDCVYRLNLSYKKSGIQELEILMTNNMVQKLIKKEYLKKISKHNQLRLWLLQKKDFRTLQIFDVLLEKVQHGMNFLVRKEMFD